MTQIASALFAWDAVEARSDLDRFYLVRDHLPDTDLIAALEAKRGLGRDDYPVIPMWNALGACPRISISSEQPLFDSEKF